MVDNGAGAEIFDRLEPEPHKKWPTQQHWYLLPFIYTAVMSGS
jgi:hypothetical protein